MIAVILVTALSLCGCRQRISDHPDVVNSLSDAGGMHDEQFRYMRDELGLSESKRPLFPTLGRSDAVQEEEEYGEDEYFEDYEDEYEDEDYSDDDYEDPETQGGGSGGGTSHTYHPVTPSPHPVPIPVNPGEAAFAVSLDPNGGICEIESVVLKKGDKYGELPTPEYEGYTFLGWFTEKDGGSQVNPDTEVTASAAHSLYAHWEKTPEKTYKVTFKPNGGALDGDTSIRMEEGASYGFLPKPEREGYVFLGWFTDREKGKQVRKGDTFSGKKSVSLYAHWDEDKYAYWDKQLAAERREQVAVYFYENEDSDADDFADSLNGRKSSSAEEQLKYQLIFLKDMSRAETAAAKALEEHPDALVIVMSRNVIKGKNNKEVKLYAKYLAYYTVYPSEDSNTRLANIAEELGVDPDSVELMLFRSETPPEEQSDPPEE